MPPWNAANGYYIKAEWLTGKSSLPQNCQSILPNHRERERERDREREWKREKEKEGELGVYFWALRTAECQHLIPPQFPVFSFTSFFFTLQSSTPSPPTTSPLARAHTHTHTHTHSCNMNKTLWFNLKTMFEEAGCQKCFISALKVWM